MPPRHHEGERSPYPGAVRSSRSAIDDQRRHFEDTPLCGYLTSAAAGALPASCRHAARKNSRSGPCSQSELTPAIRLSLPIRRATCLPASFHCTVHTGEVSSVRSAMSSLKTAQESAPSTLLEGGRG